MDTKPTKNTLLSLPDELLDHILATLKWGNPSSNSPTTPPFDPDTLHFYENLTGDTQYPDNICSVRLTCRRLASRTTPFLLPVATVSACDPVSIARLEEIATHAGLAPYVRAVRVTFGFYEAELALADNIFKLGEQLRAREAWLVNDAPPATADPWMRAFGWWGRFCNGGWEMYERRGLAEWVGGDAAGREGGIAGSMRLLRREHAEYRRRWEAQEGMGGVGEVVERIARAVASMPRATRLVLEDEPERAEREKDAWRATPFPEGRWLTRPTSWAWAFKTGGGAPPVETVFALPAALHRAGVTLTGLRIHRLRLPSDFPLWYLKEELSDERYSDPNYTGDPPPPEADELSTACASLRVFEYTPGYEPNCWPTESPTHLKWPVGSLWDGPTWTRLDEILEWILSSRALRHVAADLQMVHGGPYYELAMPPGAACWPGVRVLRLQDGYIQNSTLASFLEASRRTLVSLHLDRMGLIGTSASVWPYATAPFSWSAVLDGLRKHCREVRGQRGRDAEGLVIEIRRPQCAEFEDRSLSEEDMVHLKALFEPDISGRLSAVDRYIQGLCERNPLVEAGKTPLLYGVDTV